MHRWFTAASVRWVGVLLFLGHAISRADATDRRPADQGGNRFRLTFEASPLLTHVEGRPGETISLTWDVVAKDRPLRIDLRPVSLTQTPDGGYRPAVDAAAAETLKINGADRLTLRTGQTRTVKARWRLPADAGRLAAVGLMVTESTDTRKFGRRESGVGAGMQFITRYLLRVHATIRQPKPHLENLTVRNVRREASPDGPRWTLRLHNDCPMGRLVDVTLTPCNVAGRAVGSGVVMRTARRARSGRLSEDPVALLPHSRLHLVGTETEPPAETPAAVRIRYAFDGRHRRSVLLTLDDDRAGPAPPTSSRIEIEPGEVVVDTGPGGERYLRVVVTNALPAPATVTASIVGPMEAVLSIRPDRATLRPGSERRFELAVDRRHLAGRGEGEGSIRFVVTDPSESQTVHEVPVRWLRPDDHPTPGSASPPNVPIGAPHTDPGPDLPPTATHDDRRQTSRR